MKFIIKSYYYSPMKLLTKINSLFRFSNESKPKSILLSYQSPLTSFTFLNCNISTLPKSNDTIINTINAPFIANYLENLRQNIPFIKKIQLQNYGFIDVHEIVTGGRSSSPGLTLHRIKMKALGQLFSQTVQEVIEKIHKDFLIEWMQICWKLQIIDIRVWSKFLSLGIGHLRSHSQQKQSLFINYCHKYFKSKFLLFNHSPSKFIYRQNYIVDLADYKAFFSCLMDCIVKGKMTVRKTVDFCLIVELIQKVSKVNVLNFSRMVQHFKINQKSYLNIIEVGDLTAVLNLLKFISILGISDKPILTKIQQKLTQLWNNDQNISQLQKCKSISTILMSWNNLHYNNPTVYTTIIQPFIHQQLISNKNQNFFSVWLFNTVACDIEDLQTCQQLISKIMQNYSIQNKIVHIVSHYISIKYGIKRLSVYPNCQQTQTTIDIVSKLGKSYSNCMTQAGKSSANPRQNISLNTRFQKQTGFEQNPPEQFWLKLLKKAFDQLKTKYPTTKNQIYFNYQFCAFEIDALVILNGHYIAFQLIGTHYRTKSLQNGNDEFGQLQGRKSIKYSIIQAYGIKLLEINSFGKLERNINSLKEEEGGIKYLCSRLNAIMDK